MKIKLRERESNYVSNDSFSEEQREAKLKKKKRFNFSHCIQMYFCSRRCNITSALILYLPRDLFANAIKEKGLRCRYTLSLSTQLYSTLLVVVCTIRRAPTFFTDCLFAFVCIARERGGDPRSMHFLSLCTVSQQALNIYGTPIIV